MNTRAFFSICVSHSHRVPLVDDAGNPAGSEGITDPWTEEEVLVEVDMEGIAKELGPRACRSKGKRAQALCGFVVVTAKPAGCS